MQQNCFIWLKFPPPLCKCCSSGGANELDNGQKEEGQKVKDRRKGKKRKSNNQVCGFLDLNVVTSRICLVPSPFHHLPESQGFCMCWPSSLLQWNNMGVTSMSRFLIYANLDTGLKDVTHTHTHTHTEPKGASQVMLVLKNPPANAGDIRNSGLIPGLGTSPGEGNGYHSSILAWQIPWTEEPGGSIGSQRVGHNCSDSMYARPQNTEVSDYYWFHKKIPKNIWYNTNSSGHIKSL